MRAFLAVEPSGEAREALLLEVRSLSSQGRWLRPVGEDQLHLTLRFFADIPEGSSDEIREALSSAGLRAFTTRLAGIGAFPDWRRPRVIWQDLSPEGWDTLHRGVDDALAGIGLGRDERFSPHITLARVKMPGAPADVEAVRRIPLAGTGFPVEELLFKKSVLTPQGARHTTLWKLPLQKGAIHSCR